MNHRILCKVTGTLHRSNSILYSYKTCDVTNVLLYSYFPWRPSCSHLPYQGLGTSEHHEEHPVFLYPWQRECIFLFLHLITSNQHSDEDTAISFLHVQRVMCRVYDFPLPFPDSKVFYVFFYFRKLTVSM